MTIFDIVTAPEIGTVWNALANQRAPYLGEELFPARQKLGMQLSWLKGSAGLPVALKPSALDAAAIPRPRLAFDKLSADMPFFKESKLIDETTRQELNKVLESNNPELIKMVVENIFNEPVSLIDGARAQREAMRMQLLTSGMISFTGNGQSYDYDYHVPVENKVNSSIPWSNPNAHAIQDIIDWQSIVEDKTGVKPTRATCSPKTFGYLLRNNEIRAAVWGKSITEANAPIVTDERLNEYFMAELGLEIVKNGKKYQLETDGEAIPFVPDDVFSMFPTGDLGNTWFGTTPEQSDLMSYAAVNVSIVDTGVAVTTMKKEDPVNVETKVTMICLPDFPAADKLIIADVS